MTLALSHVPGFSDLSDSALAANKPALGLLLAKISDNAAFGMVRLEVFSGTYSHGQTVSLPVSTVDGYNYSRSELMYLWMPVNTGAPNTQWATDGPPWTMWYGAWSVDQLTGNVKCAVGYRGNDDHKDRQANTNDSTLQVFTIAQRGLTTLVMGSQPSYTAHVDADFYQDKALNTSLISSLNDTSKFGVVNTEVIYMGVYKHGDFISRPTSPVDGYKYTMSEVQWMTSMYWTADDDGGNPANMKVPDMGKGQLQDWQTSITPYGGVNITITYQLNGVHTYNTGRVAVFAFCTRANRTLQQTFAVNGTSQPWSTTANPTHTFSGGTGVNGTEIPVTVGDVIDVVWESGTANNGSGTTPDANGFPQNPGNISTVYESVTPKSNAMAVIGVFVDASHVWVGTPFHVGVSSGPITVPVGAVKLSLGVDDAISFLDNTGAYNMKMYKIQAPSIASSTFVEQDLSTFMPGSTLRASTMQQLSKNIREACLTPEFFGPQTHVHGDTIALPTSPIDGYAYSRSELQYVFDWINTGPSSFSTDRLVLSSASISSTGVVSINNYRFQSGGTNWQLEHTGSLRVLIFAKRNVTAVVPAAPAAQPVTATVTDDSSGAITVDGV